MSKQIEDEEINKMGWDPLELSEHTEATVDSADSSDGEQQQEEEPRRQIKVQFGSVQVRHYERVVGDHPDTRIGVPLSLGWGYNEKEPVPIQRYEADRISKGNLRMSSISRKNLLHTVFGIPEEELRQAEKEVQQIRKGRVQSNKQGKLSAKTESAMKSFRRKIRKALSVEKIVEGIAMASSSMMVPTMSASAY